ncbi:MAG TPA: crosslink repair DNA glycosylase YcaQ family protein [Lacunisphaera sp.]|nr:crosslink repair DNA glycosylase YcaQ family protein [Lacunisphaera sp.]
MPEFPRMPLLPVSPEIARRFMRRALLLDAPAPDIATALAHHGYIQIDPINVTGRMHDLILRNRVLNYREGGLHTHIHSPGRPGFEHYIPHTGILVAFPAEAWPHLAPLLANRRLRRTAAYRRKLSPKHEQLARHILAEIAARGPLTTDDIEHEGRSVTGWGSPGRLVKNLLEVLLVHGRVLITARRNFRRVYDLPERVLPAAMLAAPEPAPEETARWLVLLKLRQRRLLTLKRSELLLVGDFVQAVRVEGCPLLYCLRSDLPILEEIQNRESKIENLQHEALLLAPLDPLIYDRRVTSALWNFDYTWEVYTPPAKRQRGYYALPVLAGTEIIGHVDPKADREKRKLRIVSRSVRRGHKVAPAVATLAKFLSLA